MVTGRCLGQTVTGSVTYGNREGVTHGDREQLHMVTERGHTW